MITEVIEMPLRLIAAIIFLTPAIIFMVIVWICEKREVKPREHEDILASRHRIEVANGFYNEMIQQQKQPLRKATGLFSDEAAQEMVRR